MDGQVYPAAEGPRWALPTWKREGFILRTRRAAEESTPRTGRQLSTGEGQQGSGYKLDQREARGKAERLISRLLEQIKKEQVMISSQKLELGMKKMKARERQWGQRSPDVGTEDHGE